MFLFKTQTGRVRHDPFIAELAKTYSAFFLFFLHFNNFATLVESTVGTYGVREAHRAAVGTSRQVAGLQGVVRTAHIAAALGMLALWMWGH